jgi:sigma-B regulation protein RsbU (phosphoserine phosphatase)
VSSHTHREPSDARTGRRRRVALLVDRLANEYTDAALAEVTAAAREKGVGVVCFAGGRLMLEDLFKNRQFVLDLANPRTVDAVLVLPLGGHIGSEEQAAFCRRYEPMPICSIAVPWAAYPSVVIENDAGLRQTMRHLVETHERRGIAFIRGPERNSEAELRYRVYREVLAEYEIPFDPDLVAPGSFDVESGGAAVQVLLDERQTSFNAIVAANDAMAIGAIDELRRRQIVVPHDVAVTGFDDIAMSRYLDPSLTTVRQPLRVQARIALQSVVGELSGTPPTRQTILQAVAVIRESCGCASHLSIEPWLAMERSARTTSDVAEGIRALNIAGAPESPWPEQLEAALAADLRGESGVFAAELSSVVRAIAGANGDLGALQKVITLLQQSVPPANALFHAARVELCGAAERVPARRMLVVEHLSQSLLLTNRALATAVNIESLAAALARLLPDYGIAGCFVCRREDGQRSCLVLAYANQKLVTLPAAGLSFSSADLLPEGMLAEEESSIQIVIPVEYGGDQSGYVVFDRGPVDGFVYTALVDQIGAAFKKMRLLDQLVAEAKARETAEAQRLAREMSLARDIQTGSLPRAMRAEGLEIAAAMRPATEVGGDYYDVIPSGDACWIGIGDVAGHGLPTGLVMLMLQSVVSGLARKKPDAAPSEILHFVNAVLFENVRRRMEQDEHVTLTLLRYHRSGRVAWAGAHEDILICRADGGRIDWIPAQGTWVAAVADIRASTVDRHFELAAGDLMVLYSDGITEARSANGEMFGVDRLAATVQAVRDQSVDGIRDALLSAVTAWAVDQDDDMTVLVARQVAR